METIHFKTVDPVSQDLLRGASQKGLSLNWERYEKQQPQDGFLRLGLSCPYGCMQGPCRIDPYGRGADRGICGLDRDAMAAAFLLRLTLQGVLETMHAYPAGDAGRSPGRRRSTNRLRRPWRQPAGGLVSTGEIAASAVMLARPSATPEELVRQAVRLGLLGIGIAEAGRKSGQSSGSRGCRVGYGLLAGEAITIGLAGRVPAAQVEALLKAGGKKPDVRLVSLGEWLPAGEGFLPIVCTSGEAETVLSSGKINLLLVGPQCDPGIPALCARMKVPVLMSSDNPAAAAVLKQARAAFEGRGPSSFSPDAALIGEGRVSIGEREIQAALKDGPSAKIALIGGADTLLQSLGHLPVELAKALRGEALAVASWGDAALWMLKAGASRRDPGGGGRADDRGQDTGEGRKAFGNQGDLLHGSQGLPGVHAGPGARRTRAEGFSRRARSPLGEREGPHGASGEPGGRGRDPGPF